VTSKRAVRERRDQYHSGDEVNANDHKQIFQRKMEAFCAGTLMGSGKKRDPVGPYLPVEEKLLQYMDLRSQLFIRTNAVSVMFISKRKQGILQNNLDLTRLSRLQMDRCQMC
jgi:hypothetical protein